MNVSQGGFFILRIHSIGTMENNVLISVLVSKKMTIPIIFSSVVVMVIAMLKA